MLNVNDDITLFNIYQSKLIKWYDVEGDNMKKSEKKSEMIGVKITPSIKAKLAEIADREDRSISYIVNKLIEEYLKKETQP